MNILRYIGRLPKRFYLWGRRHPFYAVPIVLVTLLILWGIYGAFQPTQPDYVTNVVERKDVSQTVEGVGTVISERDLGLQFQVAGIVAQILVKEGDMVRAGQRLAALKAGTRSADIASAQAQVRSAQADFQALQEGSRPEDIAIIEAQVANKRASLDAAKSTLKNSEDALKNAQQKLDALLREAETSLSGYVSTARSTVSQQTAVAESALGAVEDVFNTVNVQDSLSKDNSDADNVITQQSLTATSELRIAQNGSTADYQAALNTLKVARSAIGSAANVVQYAYDTISRLPTTSYFTDSVREEHKATLASERSKAQAALSAVDSAVKTLQDASANLDTRIVSEESNVTTARGAAERAKADIQTYETSLRIDEAQLALKRAGARQTDLDAAAGRLQSARASLARAAASFSETVITAPIDGKITKVDLKLGEYSPTGPAISMLGSSPFRVELFVSEIDIPKIVLSQSGSIELDAFPGVLYDVRVNEIDSASTEVEGVSKFRTKLDFLTPTDDFKIGMKGDVTILTGERKDVVAIPTRAIIENDEGEEIVRILKEDGTTEEVLVTLGLEGDSDTEILTGLSGGETIVVLVRQ